MNRKKLAERQRVVLATELKERAPNAYPSRRGTNHVEKEVQQNEEFDSFFDFESELSGMKPSNSQYSDVYGDDAEEPVSDGVRPVTMSKESVEIGEGSDFNSSLANKNADGQTIMIPSSIGPIVMSPSLGVTEEEGEVTVYYSDEHLIMERDSAAVSVNNLESAEKEADTKKKGYTDVVGFKFVRCNYTMKSGSRCKRQAPKGAEICSIHKKMIESR